MSVKLFFFLALAAVGALAQQDINEIEFSLEGRRYTETVVDGDDYQVVVVPKQGVADHTMVLHDFQMSLTAFKDLTTGRCIVIPMNHMIVRVRGLIFKDRRSSTEAVPSQRNVMLEVDGNVMEDIDVEAGDKIAELCEGLPTFWATISKEASTFPLTGRRFRRWGVSASGSVSSNGRSGSAAGNASAGGNSASSSSSSSNANGGGSKSSGSAN